MPVGSGPQHPEHTVHENTVVRSRPAHRFHSPRQQTLDPKPLHIAQLISTYAHADRTTNQSPPKSLYVDTA
jgi:hypothetical protein